MKYNMYKLYWNKLDEYHEGLRHCYGGCTLYSRILPTHVQIVDGSVPSKYNKPFHNCLNMHPNKSVYRLV